MLGVFRDFRNARNVDSQTAIPWGRQSLGATASRLGLFRTIIGRAIGVRGQRIFVTKNGGGRGNDDNAHKPQVQEYG